MLKLNELGEKLRRRIQRQLDQEDAAKSKQPTVGNNAAGVLADDKESTQRNALVSDVSGEVESWCGTAQSFEIVFRVFSVRPGDWDGYEIKALQDMVVHAGILQSDDWLTLQGRIISDKAHSKEEERVEIEIVPL